MCTNCGCNPNKSDGSILDEASKVFRRAIVWATRRAIPMIDQYEESYWSLLECHKLAHTRGLNVRATRGFSSCGMTPKRYDTA